MTFTQTTIPGKAWICISSLNVRASLYLPRSFMTPEDEPSLFSRVRASLNFRIVFMIGVERPTPFSPTVEGHSATTWLSLAYWLKRTPFGCIQWCADYIRSYTLSKMMSRRHPVWVPDWLTEYLVEGPLRWGPGTRLVPRNTCLSTVVP